MFFFILFQTCYLSVKQFDSRSGSMSGSKLFAKAMSRLLKGKSSVSIFCQFSQIKFVCMDVAIYCKFGNFRK